MRAFTISLFLIACGGGGGGTDNDAAVDDGGPSADAAIDAPADAAPQWELLIERPWTVAALNEANLCRRIAIPADMHVSAIRITGVAPLHQALLIETTSGAVGDFDCAPQIFEPGIVAAGGPGTDDLVFPAGVALKLDAGKVLTLNIHVGNLTNTSSTGMASVYVQTVPASAVQHEADFTLAGSTDISIPGNNLPHVVTGACAPPATWNVVALWPHMHGYGTKQTVYVVPGLGGSPVTLHDMAYSDDAQHVYPQTGTVLTTDQFNVECTFVNSTSNTVFYGDSILQENCFAGVYKYPAGVADCIEMP